MTFFSRNEKVLCRMRQAGKKFVLFGYFVEAILVLLQEGLRSNEIVVVLIVLSNCFFSKLNRWRLNENMRMFAEG